jgi:hypothetical protein
MPLGQAKEIGTLQESTVSNKKKKTAMVQPSTQRREIRKHEEGLCGERWIRSSNAAATITF